MERRPNRYPANCCVCGAFCEAGAGWLYADTRAGRCRGNSGSLWSRFPKKVKCERCHHGGYASKVDLPENKKPTPKRVSVTEIRKGQCLPGFAEGRWGRACPVVWFVLPDGAYAILGEPDPIRSFATTRCGYQVDFGDGREVTPSAEKALDEIAASVLETYRVHLES